MPRPRISIVVPTLNEAEHLPETLASLRHQADAVWREVIVVDGGSSDGTLAAAREAHRLLTAPRGRASQMNRGAAAARGDALLFLHADTRLAPDALTQVAAALDDATITGGALRLRIDAPGPLLRLVAGGVNLRARLLGLPYGDQALFLRRAVFERLGGYRDLPIMEDVDLVRRLRRAGRMVLLPATATTSARRWRAHGVLRTTLCNWAAIALFAAGVDPARVRWCYDRLLPPGRPISHDQAPPRSPLRRVIRAPGG